MPVAPSLRTLAFGPLPQPVRFTDCDRLIEAIRSILPGWDIREVDPAGRPSPVIRLKRTRRGYRRVSTWRNTPALAREKVRRSVVGALCGFHFEFVDWYLSEHPEQLCLHGAAARFESGLVVFPAMARAGKSLLSVQLASEGVRLFGDDVLPVDPESGEGIALGILPRLRPPLPQDATSALRAYVRSHRGPGRGNRLYVAVDAERMAPLGERAPIGGVVLLQRDERQPPALDDTTKEEALETIILQNFARHVPPLRILDTLHRVIQGAACYRLRYRSVAEAVPLLATALGTGFCSDGSAR